MTSAKVLADTNIVSYVMRGGPEAVLYAPHLSGNLISISFITVGELYFGAEKKQWGPKKRVQLEETLHNFVVIPYDNEIARCFGRVTAQRARSGQPIGCADGWIAACAVRHNVPLVTHNARHFQGIAGLQIITEVVPAS